VSKQGALTSWRAQRNKSETVKKMARVRCTHVLESSEGGTSQDTKRKSASEQDSLPGEHKRRGKSVTAKEDDQVRETNVLESAKEGTS